MTHAGSVAESVKRVVVTNTSKFPIRIPSIRLEPGKSAVLPKDVVTSAKLKMFIESGLLSVRDND